MKTVEPTVPCQKSNSRGPGLLIDNCGNNWSSCADSSGVKGCHEKFVHTKEANGETKGDSGQFSAE